MSIGVTIVENQTILEALASSIMDSPKGRGGGRFSTGRGTQAHGPLVVDSHVSATNSTDVNGYPALTLQEITAFRSLLSKPTSTQSRTHSCALNVSTNSPK